MARAVPETMSAQMKQQMSDWRSTRRAASKSLAPIKWATCTENPSEAAWASPPISHPVVSTSPMAAEAFAPRCPTIEASMKNITVAEICARIEGILRLTMSQSFSRWLIVRPSRMYDRSSSLFFTFFIQSAKVRISE